MDAKLRYHTAHFVVVVFRFCEPRLCIIYDSYRTINADDGSSMPMNATNADCAPVRFAVSMFAEGQYASRSNQAHTVLGVGLFALVAIWTAFILGATFGARDCGSTPPTAASRMASASPSCKSTFHSLRLARANAWSAATLIFMGVYLILWTQLLVAPDVDAALRGDAVAYSIHDVLQVQHIAIAFLLLACGGIDAAVARGAVHTTHWHSLWGLNMNIIGLLFLVHPQHSWLATTQHIWLGTMLSIGAQLFATSKRLAMPDSFSEDPYAPLAGMCFFVAAIILCSFRERVEAVHYGYTAHCQPRFSLTIFGLSFALCSLLLTIFVSIRGRYVLFNGRQDSRRLSSFSSSSEAYERQASCPLDPLCGSLCLVGCRVCTNCDDCLVNGERTDEELALHCHENAPIILMSR
jgi:hypothetical protein